MKGWISKYLDHDADERPDGGAHQDADDEDDAAAAPRAEHLADDQTRRARRRPPTDRSMPPVRITNVMPTASTSRYELSMSRFDSSRALMKSTSSVQYRCCPTTSISASVSDRAEHGQVAAVESGERASRPRSPPSGACAASRSHLDGRLMPSPPRRSPSPRGTGVPAGGPSTSAQHRAQRRRRRTHTAMTTRALNSGRGLRRQLEDDDGPLEGGQQHRADEQPAEVELAAVELRAADDDGHDRVELLEQADVVGVGGHESARRRPGRRVRRAAPADDVDGPGDAPGPHAREPAGLAVDADGLEEHPRARCGARPARRPRTKKPAMTTRRRHARARTPSRAS